MLSDDGLASRVQALERTSARHDRVLFGHYDEDTGRREMGLVDALPTLRLFPKFAAAVIGLLAVIATREVLTAEAWTFLVHAIGGSK